MGLRSWIGKGAAKGAIGEAKETAVDLSHKFLEIIKAPPAFLSEGWSNLSPEDRELFREAGVSALRLTAKVIIAADKSGKKEF